MTPSAADRERARRTRLRMEEAARHHSDYVSNNEGRENALAAEFAAARDEYDRQIQREIEIAIEREIARRLDAMFRSGYRRGWRDCREAAAMRTMDWAKRTCCADGLACTHQRMAIAVADAIRALEPKEAERGE